MEPSVPVALTYKPYCMPLVSLPAWTPLDCCLAIIQKTAQHASDCFALLYSTDCIFPLICHGGRFIGGALSGSTSWGQATLPTTPKAPRRLLFYCLQIQFRTTQLEHFYMIDKALLQ